MADEITRELVDKYIDSLSKNTGDVPDLRALEVLQLVHKQAEDDGLWFIARTAPEAYLQQELRLLHALIEELYGR